MMAAINNNNPLAHSEEGREKEGLCLCFRNRMWHKSIMFVSAFVDYLLPSPPHVISFCFISPLPAKRASTECVHKIKLRTILVTNRAFLCSLKHSIHIHLMYCSTTTRVLCACEKISLENLDTCENAPSFSIEVCAVTQSNELDRF